MNALKPYESWLFLECRGALVMPGALGSSDEWLFGLGPSLPAAEHLLASGCQEVSKPPLYISRGDGTPDSPTKIQSADCVWFFPLVWCGWVH